jgi:hypothetical protein
MTRFAAVAAFDRRVDRAINDALARSVENIAACGLRTE